MPDWLIIELLFGDPTRVYISQLKTDKCNPKLCNKIINWKKETTLCPNWVLSCYLVKHESFCLGAMNNFNGIGNGFLHYLHLCCHSCNGFFKAYILEGDDNTCSQNWIFLASLSILLWQHYQTAQAFLSCSINRRKRLYGVSADKLLLIPLLI